MGRVAVRNAVQAAVEGASIDNVGTVYPARPVVAEEIQYVETLSGQAIQMSANGSSSVIVVNIPSDDRAPYALAGRGPVADFDIHEVVLEIFFANTAGDGIVAQTDYDAIVDALKILIRGNPTLSAPQTIWSAGEYRFGVRHKQQQPYTSEDGTTVLINGEVRFQAWEQDVGYGV